MMSGARNKPLIDRIQQIRQMLELSKENQIFNALARVQTPQKANAKGVQKSSQ